MIDPQASSKLHGLLPRVKLARGAHVKRDPSEQLPKNARRRTKLLCGIKEDAALLRWPRANRTQLFPLGNAPDIHPPCRRFISKANAIAYAADLLIRSRQIIQQKGLRDLQRQFAAVLDKHITFNSGSEMILRQQRVRKTIAVCCIAHPSLSPPGATEFQLTAWKT